MSTPIPIARHAARRPRPRVGCLLILAALVLFWAAASIGFGVLIGLWIEAAA